MIDRLRAPFAAVVAAAVLSACGAAAASPTPVGPLTSPPASAQATTAAPVATAPPPSEVPAPSGSAPSVPSESPPVPASPSPTPLPAPPTAEIFWQSAAGAIDRQGRLRVRVIGPSPGELRYQPDRSATAVDGRVVFVCVGSRAFDGQSGFDEVPGAWTCGSQALVQGFRRAGLPMDAWSAELPSDEDIDERVEVLGDGSWEWRYRATNAVFGGRIEATVRLDPATGEVRSARRSDPTGETTYGVSYSEVFPDIAIPS